MTERDDIYLEFTSKLTNLLYEMSMKYGVDEVKRIIDKGALRYS